MPFENLVFRARSQRGKILEIHRESRNPSWVHHCFNHTFLFRPPHPGGGGGTGWGGVAWIKMYGWKWWIHDGFLNSQWISRISPFGIGLEKQGFRTASDITGQTFQGVGLKLKALILTFRDLASRLWQKLMRVAGWTDLKWERCSQIWGVFQNPICCCFF